MGARPEWLRLGEEVIGPLLADTSDSLAGNDGPDFHVAQLPLLALHHFTNSLQTSIDTNTNGRHSVSLSLLRHAVEALTVIELGLVDTETSYRLLERWEAGKKTHGELRSVLERTVWSQYGPGLWSEPWPDYFGRLARAVQPYAHCSPELMQWSLSAVTDMSDGRFLAAASTFDPVKASRLALFHILVAWTLGRLLFENRQPGKSRVAEHDVQTLGLALRQSELLVEGKDWSVQLWPHMFSRIDTDSVGRND